VFRTRPAIASEVLWEQVFLEKNRDTSDSFRSFLIGGVVNGGNKPVIRDSNMTLMETLDRVRSRWTILGLASFMQKNMLNGRYRREFELVRWFESRERSR
jgi:hypothetical protein